MGKCINDKCYFNGSLERHSKVKDFKYPVPKCGCRKLNKDELKDCILYEEGEDE